MEKRREKQVASGAVSAPPSVTSIPRGVAMRPAAQIGFPRDAASLFPPFFSLHRQHDELVKIPTPIHTRSGFSNGRSFAIYGFVSPYVGRVVRLGTLLEGLTGFAGLWFGITARRGRYCILLGKSIRLFLGYVDNARSSSYRKNALK